DDEGAAHRRPVVGEHAEGPAQGMRRVGDNREVDFLQLLVPGEERLMTEEAVGAGSHDLGAALREIAGEGGERRDLAGAQAGEIGRIKNQHPPAAVESRQEKLAGAASRGAPALTLDPRRGLADGYSHEWSPGLKPASLANVGRSGATEKHRDGKRRN